ncbi:uncharacterized protein LOC100888157 [Strongylocentrotus purpuratus]|uniref:Uncharacterized protein n=1 Tax=Strongylocentrotus purpuratus TaxID=7668 RepID=A0A7M7GK49_STRPU|nr:uncharacterized protein LOC100888157 [Strongylocentrotus purpuratus]XP_011671542.2 uncharacterized protein LOC100888157 [Strongylocentrotus purpuratus]XP_030834122.1 uncharacterized protein LOC100888157 [Strongylocentrotus purpuratus]XP_030834123.1 uncharacterized protein LOC100888157 [Strongylocentrotus purpuratus]
MSGDGGEISLGPFADAVGVTHGDLTNPVAGRLTTIKCGLVFEIIDNIPTHNAQETADLLLRLAHPDSIIHTSKPLSLRLKIAKAVRERAKLRKNKKAALPNFFNTEFVPPVAPPLQIPAKRTYEELHVENNEIKQKLAQLEEEQKKVETEYPDVVRESNRLQQELADVVIKHRNTLTTHAKDINKLMKEKAKLQSAYELKSNKLDEVNMKVDTLKGKSQAKSEKINSLKKQVKRDSECKGKKVKKIHDLEQNKKEMEQQVAQKDECIERTKELMEEAKSERRAALKDLSQIKRRAKESQCNLIATNEAKIKELKNTIEQNDVHVRELEQLNVLLEGDVIHTFEGGRFINEMRETIMVLLTECNVSMPKVGNVITTVCKNLLGKLPDKLPSHGTLHRILNEAKFVAQTQIMEYMEEGGDPSNLQGNTLHSDATTKFHRHYQGFQVTLPDKEQISIGLVEVGAGDAETYLDAFKRAISDIAEAVCSDQSTEQEKKIAALVTSVKNTMGDQGPTNPQFNKYVQSFREELLPHVVSNWDSLSTAAQKEIGDMGNYFCKMHLFVNFATEADKVLKINEADVIAAGKNQFAFGTESGAARLIRTSAKALTQRGCDMSGMAANWMTYLEEQNIKNHLISYRANRFNVLFYSAAATYYHRRHIFDFISTLPDPNNLLKAVQYDVQQTIYLAQIRALGIIDKVITGPFWRLVERTDNILQLNNPLAIMQNKLKSWANDASPILNKEVLFENIEIHKDVMYEALFAESEDTDFTTYTQVALEMVLTGMLLILERQAKDQLEGGKFFAPSANLLKSAQNVPTTNNVSERDFAVLDVLVRLKPAASCHSFETYILWLHNKPSAWLDQMTKEEKNKLLDMARCRYTSIRQQYLRKKDKLKQQHRQALHAKQEKKEKQEQRSRVTKVAATEGVFAYGGVWTLDSYEDKISELQPAKRKAAIYAQLKYHKRVLDSKGNPQLFQKSTHGTEHSEGTLTDNLKTLLELNNITAADVEGARDQTNLQYHTNEKITTNVRSSKSERMKKISEQRNQIKAKQQQTLLPELLLDPASLVGKKCKQKCREEDGSVEWFTGSVTAISRFKQNVISTEFDMVYDDFPEDTWTFPLLMDLKKGDLIIL